MKLNIKHPVIKWIILEYQLKQVSTYISSGKPYSGKSSDLWALGVLLYTMLYGQFPFYDNVPFELFRKIKNAEYTIPK